MAQSTSPLLEHELELSNLSAGISDDEVQTICVKKQQKYEAPLIKVDSDDEEGKDFSTGESSKTTERIDTDHTHTQVPTQATASPYKCNNPKDVTCSICLGEFDNKSFLDQCFHAFCFYCILQWSEIVRTCPLCKATFSYIVHSVKSMVEYELHNLPRQKRSIKQQQRIDRRRIGNTITLVDEDDSRVSRPQYVARSTNSWEWRARRRERRTSFHRRKQIEGKKKRKSIYANNLWVQNVSQSGRAKFRNTSPKFFHDNPACTHRLVPWLTRELNCLLNDDQSHVDFVFQLIMTLITRVDISSDDFIEQIQPFLHDKTHHFAHEFLSFARSPYDMDAHDERARYNFSQSPVIQDTGTPFVSNTSTTGWDSPEEIGTAEDLSHSTLSSSQGPSGLSVSMLSFDSNKEAASHIGRSWSPSPPHVHKRPPTGEYMSTASLSHEGVTTVNHTIVSSPEESNLDLDLYKESRLKFKGKGKQPSTSILTQPAVCIPDPTSHYVTVSSCGSTESHPDVIVISSERSGSPDIEHLPEQRIASINKRRSSSTERPSSPGPNSHQGSHKSQRPRKRRRKYSLKLSSSRVVTRPKKRTTRSRSPVAIERPSSPTEEEMKKEISDLEKKIAEDTKRLLQLLKKQENRKLNNSRCKSPNASNIDGSSGTDELSR